MSNIARVELNQETESSSYGYFPKLISHGKRFSNSFSEGLVPIFSMRLFKYSFASIPLAMAVWRMEKMITDDFAPLDVFENKNFFLAMTKGLTPLSTNRCFPDTGKCGRCPLNQSSLIALITLPNFETWHRIKYPFLNILTDSFVVLIMVLLLRSSFKDIVMSMYSSSAASMPLTSHDFCMRPAYLHIHPHIVDFATPYSLQMFFSAFPADAVSQDQS